MSVEWCKCELSGVNASRTRRAQAISVPSKCCTCHAKAASGAQSAAPATQTTARPSGDPTLSPTPATQKRRSEPTRRLKPPKAIPSAELTIGTAIWPSRGRLRTIVDGCERKSNVKRRHPQFPDPQGEMGTLATHSGENKIKGPKDKIPIKSIK